MSFAGQLAANAEDEIVFGINPQALANAVIVGGEELSLVHAIGDQVQRLETVCSGEGDVLIIIGVEDQSIKSPQPLGHLSEIR